MEHWVTLRHTGQNNGIGLVEWGAEEKDRYSARHGNRSPAGQILEFVEKTGNLSSAAESSDKGIITSLGRLIGTPKVREVLGIEISDSQIYTVYPSSEVAKGLTRVVEDLKTERVKVGDIYHVQDRINYIDSLPQDDRPNSSKRFESSRSIEDADNPSDSSDKTEQKPKPKRPTRKQSSRTSLIPKNCQLNIDPPRINAIYNELLTLSADQFPNACSVALRVFIELSVDHYISQHTLMNDKERSNTPLAKRLKKVAADLRARNIIDEQLEKAVQKVADGQVGLAASTVNFNQYVHNQYVFPKATELKVAWDELQPFVIKLWN